MGRPLFHLDKRNSLDDERGRIFPDHVSVERFDILVKSFTPRDDLNAPGDVVDVELVNRLQAFRHAFGTHVS